MIRRLHHGCITVSDMEEALGFYRDKLGLKVRMEFEIKGKEFDTLFGLDDTHARIVYFEEDVELLYFFSPSGVKFANFSLLDSGATLLIFEVDDLEKTCEELAARGVEFFAPPQNPDMEVPTIGKVPVAHVRAPDGVRISLTEHVKA